MIEAEKNGDKNWKALCKLMSNVVYGKAMENLRNTINVSLKKVTWNGHQNQVICHKIYLITVLWQFVKTKLH